MRGSTAGRAAGVACVLAGAAAFLVLRGAGGTGGGGGAAPETDGPGSGPSPGTRAAGGKAAPGDPASAAGTAIRGVVVDGAGSPIAGAEVAASCEGAPAPFRAASGADGSFLLGGLDPGAVFLLGARAPGFAPGVTGGVRPGSGEVRLTLLPPIRLSGRVRSPGGAARAGARVRVLLLYPGLAKPLGGMEVNADEEGRYAFAGLPAVPGEAEASLQGSSSGPRRYDPPAGGGGEVPLDIVLDAGSAVAGRVLSEDGRPLEGVEVSARDPDGRARRSLTRDDGTFEVPGLAAEPLRVSARDPERLYLEGREEGVVPPRAGLEFVLRRDPGAPGRFVFRCVDSAGNAVPGVTLETAREGAGRPTGLCVAGADQEGVFRPGQDQGGRYRLVLSRGAESATVECAVEPGRTTDLGTVRLLPAALLRGRVVLYGEAAPAGILVLVGDSAFPERDAVDAEGRLAIRALPPGRGSIRLAHPRFEQAVVPWSAGPGETADLGEIRLRPALGAVRGAVRTGGGPLPAGSVVRLSREDVFGRGSLDREAAPGPDGRFEFPGVPSGTWRVSAAAPAGGARHARFLTGTAGPEVVLAEGEQREVDVTAPRR